MYSGILKVKIILLGEETEKVFIKLKDRYACVKKAMKAKFKSGLLTKALSKVKEKLTQPQLLQWLDDYVRPRKSINNIESNNSDYEQESKSFSNDYVEEEDVSK